MMRSLFLALATSALGLHAGLTLSAPATTSAGETLTMSATGHGAETKERWSWVFWLDGRRLDVPAQPLHLDASTCTVSLVVPPDASNQVLKVEVRRGGEMASDTLLVVPATEDKDMGEAKHPLKKARIQAPEETKEPSVPAIDKLPATLEGALVFTTSLPLGGPGDVEIALPTLAFPSDRVLVIQASCDAVLTSPQATVLIPARPYLGHPAEEKYPDAAPFLPGTRALGEGPSAPPAASVPSRTPLARLPQDVLVDLAEYAGAERFRYLSKDLNRAAQMGTQSIVIQGNLTDAELAKCLRTHARIRRICFEPTPNLTADGIVQALAGCPRLQVLITKDAKLAARDLQKIVAQHEHLVGLFAPEVWLSEAELTALPPRLTALSCRSGDAGDPAIQRFQQLKTLGLKDNTRFTGELLPKSLRNLTVTNCSAFTGRGLPTSLTVLEARNCIACVGPMALPNLQVLRIRHCDLLTAEHVVETIQTAPRLLSLATDLTSEGLFRALPACLLELEITNETGFWEAALAHLTSLRSLYLVHSRGFTGRLLPQSLRTLKVGICPNFDPGHLGTVPLEHLTVSTCFGLALDDLPESLVSLEVNNCVVASMRLLDDPHSCRRLRSLTYLGNSGKAFAFDATVFRQHPTLQLVDFSRGMLVHLWNESGHPVGRVWRRTAPPQPPDWSSK